MHLSQPQQAAAELFGDITQVIDASPSIMSMKHSFVEKWPEIVVELWPTCSEEICMYYGPLIISLVAVLSLTL